MQNLLKLLMEHYDTMLQQVISNPINGGIYVNLRIPGNKIAMGILQFDIDIDEYGDEYEYVGCYYDEEDKVHNHVWFELLKVK